MPSTSITNSRAKHRKVSLIHTIEMPVLYIASVERLLTRRLHSADSPGVPPSATAHELFRGFSFVAPCLLEDSNIYMENKQCENVTNTFPTYVNPISITDEYDFKQEIGKGSYSTVYLAVHKATKAEYAIKVSHCEITSFSVFSMRLSIFHFSSIFCLDR